ncbi:polysaccharide pyruvyl transferase family protein, partial [candidate division KSB1 bacterium]|nr:polysaccharide pyruvyl transferase family protein [candidate division KSB1 bacterium]
IIVVSVWDHDHNIAREFVRELDSSMVRIELADQDVDSFLKVVSQCDLLISIKLHAAILAMCRSIPVVSIEYQPKCRDFMLSMELEQYNIRTDKLDTDILLNLVYKTLSDTQEIRRKIDHKIAGYIEKQKLYAQDIAKCLYTNC